MIAGGRASRFGSDKAAAVLGGVALLDHAVAALRPWVADVVVCGREWGDLVALADWPGSGLGPLGGIAAALDHAEANGFEHVLTIGCDMPRVDAGLLAELVRAVPAYCGDAPILGCYPAAAAGLRALLVHEGGARGDRSIRRWAESIGAQAIAAPAPLANVNTPADLAAL